MEQQEFDNSPLTAEELEEYKDAVRFMDNASAEQKAALRAELAGSQGGAFLSGLARGPTLDYPALESLATGKSIAELNKEIEAQRETHPWTAFAGETIGSMLIPGIPGLAAASRAVKLGSGLGSAALRGSGVGAITGGVQGLLSNPVTPGGDTLVNRVQRGAGGLLGGAVFGGLGGLIGGKLEQRAAGKLTQQEQQQFQKQVEAMLASEEAKGGSEFGQGFDVPPPSGGQGPVTPVGSVQSPSGTWNIPNQIEGQAPRSISGPGPQGPQGAGPGSGPAPKGPGPVPPGGGGRPGPSGPQGPQSQGPKPTGATLGEDPRAEAFKKLQEEAAAMGKSSMPSTTEELTAATAKGQLSHGFGDELPNQKELIGAASRLTDFETGPLGMHYEMVGAPARSKEVKRMRQTPGPTSVATSEHELQMKREADAKTNQLLKKAGSSNDLGDSSSDAVNNLESFYKDYIKTKQGLAPIFEQAAENIEIGFKRTNLMRNKIANHIDQGHPGLVQRELVEIPGNDGKIYQKLELYLTPQKLYHGISDEEYKLFSRLASEMNDKPTWTFKQLQRMREGLRQNMDFTQPKKYKNITAIRREIIGQMEAAAEDQGVPGIRDAFRSWAQNEASLEGIQDIIGGKISKSHSDASDLFIPEKVGSNILRDSQATSEAISAIGKQRVKSIIAGHLSYIANKTKNDTGYSAARFGKYLNENYNKLKLIFEPEELQRLRDLNTFRKISDSMPANVSDTALSMKDAITRKGLLGGPVEWGKTILEKQKTKAEMEQFLREMNNKWQPSITKAKQEELLRRARILKSLKE